MPFCRRNGRIARQGKIYERGDSMTDKKTNPPIIGILGNNAILPQQTIERYSIPTSYIEAVSHNGGIPMPIPCINCSRQLQVFISICDALLLPGGVDIDPVFYGEDPHPKLGTVQADMDEVAFKLLSLAFGCKMPVLGICRGQQVINVAKGGTLYQDIAATYEKESIMHQQTAERSRHAHSVTVKEGTLLHEILGSTEVRVNTFHHQSVKAVGHGMIVSAYAPDGIIEAIESTDGTVLGVQWHPENLIYKQAEMNRLFAYFVNTMAVGYRNMCP